MDVDAPPPPQVEDNGVQDDWGLGDWGAEPTEPFAAQETRDRVDYGQPSGTGRGRKRVRPNYFSPFQSLNLPQDASEISGNDKENGKSHTSFA